MSDTTLKEERDRVLQIFGDYDFTPTYEQACEMFSAMRNRIIRLEGALDEIEMHSRLESYNLDDNNLALQEIHDIAKVALKK